MIEDVRQQIKEKEAIPHLQQRLFFLKSAQLSDDCTLRLVGKSTLIYIRVLSVTGELVPLGVEPTDTIESVKWMYHDQEGILPDKQLLFFGSNELENERTVFDYGIPDKARLELLISMPSIPITGQIQVLIQKLTSNNRIYPLVVELTDTVMSLKQKIYAFEGIPPEQQRLIFTGGQMEDERLLWTYGLQNDYTINLSLEMRGD